MPKIQTYTVASAPTVTGSVFKKKFRDSEPPLLAGVGALSFVSDLNLGSPIYMTNKSKMILIKNKNKFI